nr:immunoglobulin heavy chain junction region [Mus musculus]
CTRRHYYGNNPWFAYW